MSYSSICLLCTLLSPFMFEPEGFLRWRNASKHLVSSNLSSANDYAKGPDTALRRWRLGRQRARLGEPNVEWPTSIKAIRSKNYECAIVRQTCTGWQSSFNVLRSQGTWLSNIQYIDTVPHHIWSSHPALSSVSSHLQYRVMGWWIWATRVLRTTFCGHNLIWPIND